MNKRNKIIIIALNIVVLILFTSCTGNQCIDQLTKNKIEYNLNEILKMDVDTLQEAKGKGMVEEDKENNLVTVTYTEKQFEVKDVDIAYYFEKDELIGMKLFFPKDTDIKDVRNEISKKIGEPSLVEIDEENNNQYLEWVESDEIYYTLNNFNKLEEDNYLLELSIIILDSEVTNESI